MKDKTKKELRRQLVHASGIALVPLAFLFGKTFVGSASLIFAFAIFILAEHMNNNMKRISKKNANEGALKSVHDKSAHNSFQTISNSTHSIFQKFERSGGNYRGAFYFYLSSAVSLFLFPLQIAMLSIAVLALGDSFSTAAGIFGKRRIFYNRKKTWEGTIAGFSAAFAGCFLINPYLALPAALAGMFVESLPIKIDDNLTVPILTGIMLSIIADVL